MANCTTCKWKKQLLQKTDEGRFYKNGGKKEGFSVFPSKIHSFSPEIMELRKIAGYE